MLEDRKYKAFYDLMQQPKAVVVEVQDYQPADASIEITEAELASLEIEMLEDTERGQLDGIGMAAECPVGAGDTPKSRRALFRHLEAESLTAPKRVAQNYRYDQKGSKIRIRNYPSFAGH